MKYIIVLLLCLPFLGYSQGPPILSDKPIMLSEQTFIAKTLIERRYTDHASYTNIPLMLHYLPSRNSIVAVHVPMVSATNKGEEEAGGFNIGDVELMGKYQFYRRDSKGKTLRTVAKTIQTIGTGKPLDIPCVSTGNYQSYFGVVTGYETLKYGISNEIGYNIIPANNLDEFRLKLGFGLPLLKQVYPVNQINLFFEYVTNYYPIIEEYNILYSQGIQYAKGKVTIEAAVQVPLVQEVSIVAPRKYSLFFGSRYIIN